MIKVIDSQSKTATKIPEGNVQDILGPANEGTRVTVSVRDVEAGRTSRITASDRTQVVYILEGQDARIAWTSAGKTAEHDVQRRAGVYLEPGEEASITASGTALTLL